MQSLIKKALARCSTRHFLRQQHVVFQQNQPEPTSGDFQFIPGLLSLPGMKKTKFLYVTTASAVCCALLIVLYFLVQTTLPSADVLAGVEAQTPRLSVDDFEPGDVRVIPLDNLPIIVWRRNENDKALAVSQDAPDLWKVKYSNVLGRNEPVLATDENLTLNGEWFFAIAEISESPGWIPLLRAGNFGGFFDVKYAGHYDLAGRIRHQGRDNLTVVMAEMSEDGKTIQLDLRR